MTLRERIEDGSPFRLGELARLLGYSREQLRKWADAGALRTARAPRPGAHRRVSVEEAERFARELGTIQAPGTASNATTERIPLTRRA